MQKIEFKQVAPNFVEGIKEKDRSFSDLTEFLDNFLKNTHYRKGKILAYNINNIDDFFSIFFNALKENIFDVQPTAEQEKKLNDALTILQNSYDKNKNINLENVLTFLLGSIITMYQPFYEINNSTDKKQD